MKFLADQDVYNMTIAFLRSRGHDVITAGEAGMSRASDETLLKKGRETRRIVLTRDKDFGRIVFLQREASSGLMLLRGGALNIDEIHKQIETVIHENEEKRLLESFCVVEPDRYRIRHLPQ